MSTPVNAFNALSPQIVQKLKEMQILQPTNVQNEVSPLIAQGKSVLFQSETGTGKTYAYLLPLVNKLEEDADTTKLRVIVCAPTFELASQINAAAKKSQTEKLPL